MASTVVEILARLRLNNAEFIKGLREGAKEVKDLGGRFQDAAGKWREANGRFTTAADRMKAGLTNAGESTRQLQRAVDREAQSAERAASSNNKVAESHRRLGIGGVALGGILANVATGGATMLASGLFRLASSGLQATMSMEQSKIAFTTMMGSAKKAGDYLQELSDLAAKTPFELADLVTGSRRLMAMGFSAEKAKEMLIAVGDASSGLGIGSEGINRITLALGQMKAKGKIAGDEMLQMSEAGVPALQYLADTFGTTTADMQKMISKGLVPADKGIQAIVDGMEKGTKNAKGFGGMMAAQSKTLQGVFSTFKDEVSMAMVKAFTPLIPQLTKLITAATPIAGKFVSLFADAIGAVISAAIAMGPALKTVGSVIGSIFGAIGDVVGPPLQQATNAFKLFMGVFTGNNALVAFGTSLDSGVVAKIAKFASGLRQAFDTAKAAIGTFLGQVFNNGGLASMGSTLETGTLVKVVKFALGFKSVLAAVGNFLQQGIFPIFRAIASTLMAQAPHFVKLGNALKSNLLPAGAAIVGLFKDHLLPALTKIGQAIAQKLVPAIGKVVGAILDLVSYCMPEIKKFVDQAVKVLGPAFEDIGNIISNKVVPILSEVISFLAKVIGWLQPIVKFLLGVFLGALIGALKGLVNIIKGVLNVIVGIFDFFIGLFTGNWSRAWEGIKEIFHGLWQVIVGAFQVFLNIGILKAFRLGWAALVGLGKGGGKIFMAVIEGIWNGIKALTHNFWGIMKSIMSGAWKALVALVKGGVRGIWTLIVDYFNLYKSAFRFAWNAMKSIIVDAWRGYINTVKTVGGGILDFMRSIPGKIKGALGNMGSLLYNAGMDLIRGMINGIKAMAGNLVGAAKGVVGDAVKGAKNLLGIKSPSKVFHQMGVNVTTGLAQGIGTRGRDVSNAMAGVVRRIPGAPMPSQGFSRPGVGSGGFGGRFVLEIHSGGSKMDDFIVELIRKAVRVKGGDVQIVLGVNR